MDAWLTVPGDAHDVVTELLGIGLGHGVHPSSGTSRHHRSDVTYSCSGPPLPGHLNAERAARAVESAARQGELEAMYARMYESQPTWGESREPKDDLFRSFAEEIGLDMEQFDADYASEEVADRVQRDVEDGRSLGVEGTPTFFVDGDLFQPETVEDFAQVLDEALAGE
ncbi:DsbA family protein [uncultured Nocardioides sp.]|uniref:DsbA family protein n=1 Tax=uncultured Nocardioides sp. TaxID=198441 RepID=UPI0030F7B81E